MQTHLQLYIYKDDFFSDSRCSFSLFLNTSIDCTSLIFLVNQSETTRALWTDRVFVNIVPYITASQRTSRTEVSNTAKFFLVQKHVQTFILTESVEGFHSRDLYTEVNYFECVSTQENNNADSKRLLA